MKEHKVPVQSLIDHIKTAVDVDPWAKEMAEELLKEQEAVEPRWFIDAHNPAGAFVCSACGERIIEKNIDFYCSKCGKPITWAKMEGR